MLCTMPDLLAGSDGYSMLVILQIVKGLTVYYTIQHGMLCTMPDLLAGSDGYSMLVLLQIVKA